MERCGVMWLMLVWRSTIPGCFVAYALMLGWQGTASGRLLSSRMRRWDWW